MGRRSQKILKTIFIGLLVLFVGVNLSMAFKQREKKSAYEQKEFRADELYISQTNIAIGDIVSQLPNGQRWMQFLSSNSSNYAYIDPRSARPSSIISTIPIIEGSGSGNSIALDEISLRVGYEVKEVTEQEIGILVMDFLRAVADLLRINLDEIGEIRIGHPVDYLWQIFITRQVKGVPVRDANIVLVINHGNLVLWGLEKWGDIDVDIKADVSDEGAFQVVSGFVDGISYKDEIIEKMHLELIPITPITWTGAVGTGYSYKLVWVMKFRKSGYANTWEAIVDAKDGWMLSFQDINQYVMKKIVGAIYPVSNDECCPEGCAIPGSPMAYTNTGFPAPNDYTTINGLYDYTSGTVSTTLAGRYVTIGDNCGSPSGSSTTGDLDLGGTNGQHDCTLSTESNTTFSARSGETEVTAINRTARGWVNYTWLDTAIPANMNIASTCNAYYDSTSINFYRSGGGCRNTGEIAAVFDHEWGHAIDDNDTNGTLSNPGEVIADIVASIRLHNSCIGRGFFWTWDVGCGQWVCLTNPSSTGFNCDGYGDCCFDCTGIRDSDYAKHNSGQPHTPINFICPNCSGGSGPCGREVHCENAPGAESAWDLAARDLQAAPFNFGKQTAFQIAERIVYIGSGTVTNWYACDCTGNTSDGCAATAGYMAWITADDDNGNISDGTPHMTAIYNAFNRHGIACATPTPTNSGCSGAPTAAPVLTGTATSNGAQLSWTSVPGASQYYVFKNIGTMGCDFGKVRIATVSGTTYTDEALNCVGNHYIVQPVGSNSACLGPASNCVSIVPPINPPTSVSATATAPNQVTVSWSPVSGATGYNVYRKYTLCSQEIEEKIGDNITGTSYIDNTVSGGTTYQYSVAAIAECETAKSDWVSVVATGECALAPCFDGAGVVTNNETDPCGLTVSWDAGTSSCTAYPNLKYTVYKSTDPDFIPSAQNQIATCIATTSYVDSDVAAGLTFYYIVRAEDSRTGQSGPCNGGNIEANLNRKSGSPTGPVTTFFTDTFESGLGNWTVSANWALSTTQSHSPTNSVWSGNISSQCDTLTKNSFISLPSGAFPILSFWTYYNIESGWDGGIVQGSADGTTWTKLAVSPNYPGTTNTSTPACIGTNQSCFSGSLTTWTNYTADLSSYAGGNFTLRFLFASDGSVNNGGWYIDDVVINSAATCQNGSPNCTSPPIFAGLQSAQSADTSNCQINLSWNAASSTCQVGSNVKYNIYRSIDPNFEPLPSNLIASCLTGTTYADTNVYYGTTYYYIVRAEDSTSNGNGPCNNGNIDLNLVKKSTSPSGPLTTALNDDFESGLGNWTVSANWALSTAQSHSPTNSVWSNNVSSQCDTLTLTNFLTPPAGSNPNLTFWTYYNIESGWDGGIVEVSANGSNWTKLTVSPNYPATTNTSTPACIGTSQQCFAGVGTTWTQYSADLSAYAGGNLKIRYTFASDGSINNGGWYIDDVQIKWGSSCQTVSNAPGKVLNNLTVVKSGNNVMLNWQVPGGTCEVTGYGIYKGNLPWTGYNHSSADCSITTTSYTDLNPTGSYYYLVVPLNNSNEGTYGTDSNNNQRPIGFNPCNPQDQTNCN